MTFNEKSVKVSRNGVNYAVKLTLAKLTTKYTENFFFTAIV